ncbi:MAG: phospho-N-acetylmuramoyl-pentapeptide-transferase [Oscillospiraceae bacterium]|nr:phospho-N-acetylmuramoyl-pentapeptide-transferase [Oscillospiraceae bacterium]
MRYETLIAATVIAFAVTVGAGFVLIPLLRRLKFGQTILEIGPAWHKSKQGTPTMGGFMFMLGISAAIIVMGWGSMRDGYYAHLFILGFSWLFGIIGFTDDFFKIKNKRNLGLSAIQKLMLQGAVSAAFLALMRIHGFLTSDVYVPFLDITFPLNWIVYLIFCILLVAGMVNAVNLTDGIDGLCAGITMPVAAFFTVIAIAWARGEVSLTAAALFGGMLGFLLFNFHPAKVFMGDTGSLFLGGMICGLAFAADAPLLLIPVGLVFIIEMFSVILQVLYFKATKGKRLFKMSPIHHHFEKSGWGEKTIFTVFTLITVALCVAAYFAVALRFVL